MANVLLDAFYSLGRRINKATGNVDNETEQGIVSEKFPELTLDIKNEDLLKLTQKWEKTWLESDVYSKFVKGGDENENYWLGKQFQRPEADKNRAIVDNVIFEALETYLPQVTQHNPEAVVTLDSQADPTPENLAYAQKLKQELGDLADELKLRLKLKKAARHWAIYLVGAVKLGWDVNRDIPTAKVVRPKKLILDPNSPTDEDGYQGNMVGEYRKMEASIMLRILAKIGAEEDAEQVIKDLVKEDTGTELQFIEWWTDEYMCWTMGEHVLLKKKNPHWNYDTQTEAPADATTGETPTDETTGQPQTQPQPAFNHFKTPHKPYLLLSVFNLGKQPIDDTSLIGQNLSGQDLVNKRVKQIDKNADSMNGGMVVSLERSGLTMQQANGVTEALRKGGTIAIPAGAVNEAIARMSAPPLPPDVYTQLQDTRGRMQLIFGTKGFQPVSGGGVSAVRSQIMNKQADEARISGGFSEYLEQFADDIYNWFIQLLYVYDEEYSGKEHPEVHLTIKEGSLLPKDSASLAAQAIGLAGQGKMSTLDLYKKLEYANPEEMAANAWLEVNAPEILYAGDPRVAQAIQMRQQAAQAAEQAKTATAPKPPSESINFKDLPPEGKAQMAEKAGIKLHPEGIAAHEMHSKSGSTTSENPQPDPNQPNPQPTNI